MNATHQTPAPMTEGEAGFGAGQTPASPTVPLGEAGPHSSDADAVGAPASEGPRWAPVDDDTADLLTLVANTESALPEPEQQWDHFVSVLRRVANANHGLINQNAVRPLLRGEIKSQRIGAFYNRAAKTGLIRASQDHTISNDKHGRNTGKPARVWRWLIA